MIVHDRDLAVEVDGNGPTVLLLHGLGGTSNFYQPQTEALAEGPAGQGTPGGLGYSPGSPPRYRSRCPGPGPITSPSSSGRRARQRARHGAAAGGAQQDLLRAADHKASVDPAVVEAAGKAAGELPAVGLPVRRVVRVELLAGVLLTAADEHVAAAAGLQRRRVVPGLLRRPPVQLDVPHELARLAEQAHVQRRPEHPRPRERRRGAADRDPDRRLIARSRGRRTGRATVV